MGKRSNFERKERDFYATPYHAVEPLIPHVTDKNYIEPCAGDGALIKHLSLHGLTCVDAFDLEPLAEGIDQCDMFDIQLAEGEQIITNPPWDRKILHPMIEYFLGQGVSMWLLFDADWAHTKQSAELMKYCSKIVSVGRVKWFDNKAGKDNAAWYYFVPHKTSTTFVGR